MGINWSEWNKLDFKDQSAVLGEAKTEDIMTEARVLQDKIENLECYGPGDVDRLQALYAEIEHRGYGVVELFTVTFVESLFSTN